TSADVRALLDPVGLGELVEVIVTSSDVGAAKPDPTSLRSALGSLRLAPERVLYVGDRVIDRDAAAAAGTHFAFIGDTVAGTIARWEATGSGAFADAVAAWRPDLERRRAAEAAARRRLDDLAKPPGSLG